MNKTVLRKACGFGLIVVGAIAMPIPILPGIPIVVAGVAMVGIDHPLFRPVRRWLDKVSSKKG